MPSLTRYITPIVITSNLLGDGYAAVDNILPASESLTLMVTQQTVITLG